MKRVITCSILSLFVVVVSESQAQDVAGYWLGVTYPTNPNQEIFNYTMNLTQNGQALGGTAQTANPNVPFGGVAYVTGQVNGTTVTFSEANQNGSTETKDICYWRGSMTYNATNESLIGTYENITNQTTCTEAGSGRVELYRIVLKSGAKFCKGVPVNLVVTGKDIRWYSSQNKTRMLTRGNTYSPSITQTTTFYITQTLYQNESPPVPIKIEIIEPTFTATATNSGCNQSSGSVNVASVGATGWQYKLNNGSFQNTPQFSGLAPGSYTVVVKDAAGCQASQQVTVSTDAGPTISNLVSSPPKCATANGSVNVAITGGKAPIMYSIDGGITYQNSPSFTQLAGGNYTVQVRDAAGCEANRTISLPTWQPMSVLNTSTLPTTCGKPNGEATMRATGGKGIIQYSIDGQNFQPNNTFTKLTSGAYTLVARDSMGCMLNQSVAVAPSKGPQLVEVQITNEGCGLKNGSMTIAPNLNASIVEYSIDGQQFQRTESFSTLSGGVYTLTMRDENNCVLTQSVMIPTDCANRVHLPTAFSPNADQKNDVLAAHFVFPSLQIAAFTVYDRWGSVLYNRTNFPLTSGEVLWDGQLNGQAAPEGTYVYRLDCQFPDGTTSTYRQAITLLHGH
ncbi:hypothetical protein GCM10028807_61770 [Spirosoma daeguense]